MGCRLTKDEESSIDMHHFNMLVVGYPSSGKTKLLSVINGSHHEQKNTLKINTIRIHPSMKLMVFEVSGKAQKTWKNFYPITDILMFLIDPTEEESFTKAKQKLFEIDNNVKKFCKLFVVINKVDKLFSFNDNETTDANNQLQAENKKILAIVQKLNLSSLKHQISWAHCSAETGQGIKELVSKLQVFALKSSSG